MQVESRTKGVWARVLAVCGLVSCLVLATVAVHAQSMAGRWAASGPTLDNGEAQKAILEVTQTGEQLKVNVRTPGYASEAKGTAKGNHFEIFGSDAAKPWFVGDLVGTELHIVQDNGDHWVAKAATPADEFPPLPYIDPPALHKVPYNGLAKTPPMGWNSWNKFGGRVDDASVRGMADAMVSSGMSKAGYVYINIDDTWELGRDANGNITSNKKFPDMKALADYVHSKGLRIGIYSSPGPKTCAGYEGSFGHEGQDAKTYAAWGIDYLKYDLCSDLDIYKDDALTLQAIYQEMGQALQATHRPIVYSLCEYGRAAVWTGWGEKSGGNLWRTTGDISDRWESMDRIGFSQIKLAPYAKPGHWNDPDMLEIGNGGMTADEYRTHMSLWSLLAAPLIAGNDLRTMTDETKSILMNDEVIAIDQDPEYKPVASLSSDGGIEVLMRPLHDGSVAVGLFNRTAAPAEAQFARSSLPTSLTGKRVKLRDLWKHDAVAMDGDTFKATVPSHGVVLLEISAH